MKKKILITIGIIVSIVLLTILVTNIIYNVNEDEYINNCKLYSESVYYSYYCCPSGPYFQMPCKCEDKIIQKLNILQKTMIVLTRKLI